MSIFRLFFITLLFLLSSCSQQLTTEEYLQKGQQYIDKQDWKSAIIEFKNAIKQSPDHAGARAILGHTYLLTYSSDAAIKEFKRAIKLGYDKNLILLDLGKAYEQKRDFESILNEVNVNSGLTPDVSANVHALRANAYLQTKNIDKTRAELDQASSINSQLTDVRLAWANYEKAQGNTVVQRQWLEPLLDRPEGIADAWSQLGAIEQSAGNLEAAETAFTKAIDFRNIVHMDYVSRALIRIIQNNYDGAQDDLNLLKKTGITWPMIAYAEGLIAYKKEQYDQAQNFLDSVLSKYSGYMPARLLMGITQFRKANYQSAITHLEQFRAVNPESYQANLVFASSLLKLGETAEAIKVLNEQNLKKPDDFKVLSMLGSAYIGLKEFDQGIAFLRKAVQLQPEEAGIRLQLGSAMISSQELLVSGQKEVMKAIELDPELIQANIILYNSYMKELKFNKAREIAEEYSIKNTESSLGLNLVALSYLADNKPDQAVQKLKAALDKFPADIFTSHNLARYYLSENLLDEAKALYQKVLEKNPGHLKTLTELANISAKQNNYEETLRLLKVAVQKNPKNDGVKVILAGQYLKQNDPINANQVLQNVNDSTKGEIPYLLVLAKAKMSLNENKHALLLLKKLVAKQPDRAGIYFSLGQVYLKLNQADNARKALEKTLSLEPGNILPSVMLARIDLIERKYDSFKKRVTGLYKKYPDNLYIQLLNAKLISSNKDYDRAISVLSDLIQKLPLTEVATDLATNQWTRGDRSAAISGLELWLEKNKEDAAVMRLLAQFYISEQRNKEARDIYLTLEPSEPENPVLLNNLAWLMMDSDPVKGIDFGQRALRLAPKSPAIKDTLSMLYFKNGNKEKALELSKQAASEAKGIESIQFNYAKILMANGKKSDAKAILDVLIKKTRSFDDRKLYRAERDKI